MTVSQCCKTHDGSADVAEPAGYFQRRDTDEADYDTKEHQPRETSQYIDICKIIPNAIRWI